MDPGQKLVLASAVLETYCCSRELLLLCYDFNLWSSIQLTISYECFASKDNCGYLRDLGLIVA